MSGQKTAVIELAGKQFVVNRVPMARVKRLTTVLSELFMDVDVETAKSKPQEAAQLFLDKLASMPHAILSLFIKELPTEIFEDEENGVDLPDFLAAFNTAMELNRLDVLKNGLARLVTTLGTQANQTRA